MPEIPPVRVFLRPVGTPLTIGMAGLAIASLVQSGYELGWVAKSQAAQVGVILLAVPFLLQLVASVFSYLARDGASGAAIGVLATSWLAIGLVDLISPPGSVSGALGLMQLAAAGVILLAGIVVATSNPLPGAIFIVEAVRFTLAGIYHLSAVASWENAGGVVGLVVTALAAYAVAAFALEGQQRRPVLPTLRRGRGAAAVAGGAAEQYAEVIHEPGVRETT